MPPAEMRAGPLLHPAHAILLAFPVALFTAALVADITYLNTAEIQWTNFASWLIAGALLFGGFVALWAIILCFGRNHVHPRSRLCIYLALLAVMWIVGLFNAFHHSRDAWSSVGTAGVLMSAVSAALALAAAWVGHSAFWRSAR